MDKLNKENVEESQERLMAATKDKKNILINRIVATAILSIALLLGYWGFCKYKSTTNKMGAELIEIELKREAKRKTTDLLDKAKTSKQSGRNEEALGFYEEAKSLSSDLPNIDRLIKDIKKKVEEDRRKFAEVEKRGKSSKELTLNTAILKLPKTSNEKVIKNTESERQKTVNSTLNSSSLFAQKNSRIYHKSNCPKLNTEDLIEFTSSQKAQDAGGIPCEHCNPSTYAGKNAIKAGSSNIFDITSRVQDSDKFDIHDRAYPSSFQEIWYVVNQQLNQQKERSIQQNKGKGIIITDLTRHGIYGFPHYDKYYIVIEKLDRFSTKVSLKLFSYYEDMKDKKITNIVLLPDNKTFVNKRAKKFLDKITKALAKNY